MLYLMNQIDDKMISAEQGEAWLIKKAKAKIKAEKVITSCVTAKQRIAAAKYWELYNKKFIWT